MFVAFQSIPDWTGMHYSLAHFPLLRDDILTNFESILYHLIFRIKVWDCNVLPRSSFQMALLLCTDQ